MSESIAPAPQFPERDEYYFDRKMSPATPGGEGPTRFEEGLATDPDVPADFVTGLAQGHATAPGRPNRNESVFVKPAAETMKQRAHAGSASWVDAPTFLSEFVTGSFTDYGQIHYEEVFRNGGRQERPSVNQVRD